MRKTTSKRNEKFETKVIDRSIATNWDQARLEWKRKGKKKRASKLCLCGRRILNVYLVENKNVNLVVPMGRGCVNKLFKVESPVITDLEQSARGADSELSLAA